MAARLDGSTLTGRGGRAEGLEVLSPTVGGGLADGRATRPESLSPGGPASLGGRHGGRPDAACAVAVGPTDHFGLTTAGGTICRHGLAHWARRGSASAAAPKPSFGPASVPTVSARLRVTTVSKRIQDRILFRPNSTLASLFGWRVKRS